MKVCAVGTTNGQLALRLRAENAKEFKVVRDAPVDEVLALHVE
jgi:hypothetical protein